MEDGYGGRIVGFRILNRILGHRRNRFAYLELLSPGQEKIAIPS